MRLLCLPIFLLLGVLGGAASEFTTEFAAARGTLRIVVPDPAPFVPSGVTPDIENDVFFPNGRLLARLEDENGGAITVSFDDSEWISAAERQAIYAVAEERSAEPESRHDVWQINDRRWILLAFVTPTEHVLTAQTFVDGHPLAVVFWFPRPEEGPLAMVDARDFLHDLQLEWEPNAARDVP